MKVTVTFIALLMLTTTFSHGFILRAFDGREDLGGWDNSHVANRQDYRIPRLVCNPICKMGDICETDTGICRPSVMM
uniref:Conotoxin-like unassigned superfamily 03 n=1 Tax=Conus ermineus TaxID=55423 RepID=A0A346CIS0_CONER|nr:conotoxin-like precursor unassigned superfamily 03 [Conus ermineus]